eukprot:1733544-Prymnesium_polylepis.1
MTLGSGTNNDRSEPHNLCGRHAEPPANPKMQKVLPTRGWDGAGRRSRADGHAHRHRMHHDTGAPLSTARALTPSSHGTPPADCYYS